MTMQALSTSPSHKSGNTRAKPLQSTSCTRLPHSVFGLERIETTCSYMPHALIYSVMIDAACLGPRYTLITPLTIFTKWALERCLRSAHVFVAPECTDESLIGAALISDACPSCSNLNATLRGRLNLMLKSQLKTQGKVK